MSTSMRANYRCPGCLTLAGSGRCNRHRIRWWFAAKLIQLAIVMGSCRAAVDAVATTSAPRATGITDVTGTASSSDILMHPKAPSPPPQRADAPASSTFVRLDLVGGAWDLILDNSTPDSEVRALMESISVEAEEPNPKNAGAGFAAVLAAMKYGYERTTWWFETGGALHVFERYLADLATSAPDSPVRILEVGSFEGGSALWFAKNLLLHPRSLLVCIDTWAGGPDLAKSGIDMSPVEDRFLNNMARAPNSQRVTAMKGDAVLSLSTLVAAKQSSTFDVIYVDGGHQMANALSDTLLSFRLLKVGGFLVVDDMSVATVEVAMAAVVESLGGEGRLEVLHGEEQLVLRKVEDDRWATQTSVMSSVEDQSPYLSRVA